MDKEILETEAYYLFDEWIPDWSFTDSPPCPNHKYGIGIFGWSSEDAKGSYLARFRDLFPGQA